MNHTDMVLLFPGQGSQFIGMGCDLFKQFPEINKLYEEASDILKMDLKNLILNGPESELAMTANAQPAILTTSFAIWSIISSRIAISIVGALGHSLGEYSALVASKSLSFASAVKLTHLRGKFMQEATPVGTGSMAAVIAPIDPVQEGCSIAKSNGFYCDIANYNGPNQQVISGTADGVKYVENLLKSRFKLIMLPVSAPFHCKLMDSAKNELEPYIENTKFHKPEFPVIENSSSKNLSLTNIKKLLLDQIVSPVRWMDNINTAKKLSKSMIEIGPGSVLKGLVRRIDKTINVINIRDKSDITNFLSKEK